MHLMFGLPEHVPNVSEKDVNMIENAHEGNETDPYRAG